MPEGKGHMKMEIVIKPRVLFLMEIYKIFHYCVY